MLIIQIKGIPSRYVNKVCKITGFNNVKFKKVKNSFRDLKGAMDHVNGFLENKLNQSWLKDIHFVGMMDLDNKVVVDLAHLSENNIQRFRSEVFDSEVLEFRQSKGLPVEEFLDPGCRVGSLEGVIGSFGFRARDSSNNEVTVVSGHQFTIGEIAFLGGSIIGIRTKQMNSGSVDAAYIEITDDSFGSPTITMCNTTSSILSTRLGFPGAGTFVNKRGQKKEEQEV